MAQILNFNAADFDIAFEKLVHVTRNDEADVSGDVAGILASVRRDGLSSVATFTKQFDRFDLDPASLTFSQDEIDEAFARTEASVIHALEFAADRIASYHRKQYPDDVAYEDELGVKLGWRWSPVDAAGLYAPGGRAAYPSSVLMNAIPAKVAGVKRLAMATPTPDGVVNNAVLAAAKIAGVDEIYRIGGAQAIGALAFGATPIKPVDVIVGPGNAYVAEAKRQVFGIVGIDSVAGPSEILVVSDAKSNPAWIAADLLSQAEHDPSSQSILITDDEAFAKEVIKQADQQLSSSSREATARAAWEKNSGVIIVPTLGDSVSLIDRVAPEHLELAVDEPEALAEQISHAGAIFMGRHTPEAIGDYVAGPNHVLPTGGGARFSSGLSVLNFMKRSSIIGCSAKALSRIGPAASTLADAEGLPAHATSIRIRDC